MSPAAPPAVVPSRTILLTGIREQWRLFAVAVFASLVYGALTVADAWVLGWVTDNVIAPAMRDGRLTTAAVVSTVALFLGVATVRALGIVGRRLIGGIVYFRLAADYRRRVTRQYLALPLSWHARHPTGALLSNANADVEATWQVMNPMPMAVGVLAMLIVAVIAMAAADWVLTLVGLVVFPLLFAINVVYQRALSPRVTRAQQLRAQVSEVAHESFDGALVVKTLGREAEETARFRAVTEELRDASISAGRVRSIFDPVLEALPNLGVLMVVVIGVERVLSQSADPGDVVEVAYLFTVIAFPVRAIGWVLGELPRSQVGWARVRAVLDARGAMLYGSATLPGAGPVALSLTGVRAAYAPVVDDLAAEGEPAEPPREVLRGVDLEVPAGRTVAVVGLTGSGKSTLAALLVRLTDPTAGVVRLDGHPLTELSHQGLAEAVALVPQQTFLFDDTVRDNVTLGADLPDSAVWDALRTAQADGFVSALPAGLDTFVGERGTTLSGGQRQRIALARALVRRPRLLVLDDATSAVDPDVESRIVAALRRPDASASQDNGTDPATSPTVVVVAYRKATISLADEVVLLSGGRIAERGTHAELVQRSAVYRDLVDAYDLGRPGDHGTDGSIDYEPPGPASVQALR
ncbi:MAG: Heterodimeric efflux ABC transporter, permease/ATP-binding subunit 1 [uncultured Nocardioidaceae bacterium]|uniref:Heterodimeric efflux ABC transporter, permease/ATP-binding subunit 1 n=1 Tax=uncultured Nocardioidaceae bacterium TaxID=253824 RepID=A0A6J4M651_9ACTN|nr:MAG: Heterodimeric efflux ABC transporter, permease/ATP-binding subunit 1 [uncultured Nocardioidaceae bacterium]